MSPVYTVIETHPKGGPPSLGTVAIGTGTPGGILVGGFTVFNSTMDLSSPSRYWDSYVFPAAVNYHYYWYIDGGPCSIKARYEGPSKPMINQGRGM
jgi:hypothetical protein